VSPVAVRLKHIDRFRDRHGVRRHYLRLPGRKRVALPGQPGNPEFMAAYHAALAAAAADAPPEPQRAAPGSLDALAVSFYRSGTWQALRASTATAYRRLIEGLRAQHGDKPVRMLTAAGVRALMAEKGSATAAANMRLRMLRALMAHAVEVGLLVTDPTVGVKRIRRKERGFPTWTEADIAAFEARWPSGTIQRRAFALFLYTAQRRSDVVRMGRQNLRAGAIVVRQIKTGVELELPIHSALAAELAHVPAGQMLFLETQFGKPYTSGGLYNAFAEWVRAAGLSDRSPHGLRKACARRLAEAGATSHQIASVTGHTTLREVERYTRAAEQTGLARAAMARISAPAEVVAMPKARQKKDGA
jgi:integrase